MSKRTRWLMRAGIALFAMLAMAQAPFCPETTEKGTATPARTATAAAKTATTAAPRATTAATVASTTAATAAPKAGSAASAGWDHPPLAVSFTLAPPYLSVGIACDRGLPPGAKVQLRLGGPAGPPATAEGTVGADGSLMVPFGIQRAAEFTWEYASIAPTSGAAPNPLPAGSRATVTLPADKAC